MFILTRTYIKNCLIVLYLKAETLIRLIVRVLIFKIFKIIYSQKLNYYGKV